MDSRLIIKPKKPLPKALLLKDYLLDDMSSCSSNGFKSFPRRQCCTTVRLDLKNKHHHKKHPNIFNIPSKRSALTVFQTVINAVKRLPFAAVISPENSKHKKSILPRNLSKKILKKTSFWKRKASHKGIGRWKSFDELLKETSEPLDGSSSKSWTGSFFTECSSGNSSSEVNLNLPERGNDAVDAPGNGVGVPNGDVSMDSTTSCDSTKSFTKKKWSASNEEKEQFSPVYVLDCPFDDEDDEVSSSPFQHRLARVEGTKKKLMKKIQRFDSLAELDPVNLAKRFSPLHSDNQSNEEKFILDTEEKEEKYEQEEYRAEQKALELLHKIEDTLTSYSLRPKADKLLFDFFKENVIAQYVKSKEQKGKHLFEKVMLEEAGNWIENRSNRELFLEWEVPRNRQVYVKDMEKRGPWKSLLEQENKEVALELESEVFDALVNELLVDMSYNATI